MIFGRVSVAFWSAGLEHMYNVECTYITSHHITSLRVLAGLYLISLIVSRLTPNVDSGAFYCIGQDLLGKNYTFSISSI